MGDSHWYGKTSRRRRDPKTKLEHIHAFTLERIVELGACGVSIDLRTSEQLTKDGWACAEWLAAVGKIKAPSGWSSQDRLLDELTIATRGWGEDKSAPDAV